MGKKISKKEKQRLEEEARQKNKRKDNLSFLLMCVAMVAVMWIGGYLINGNEVANQPSKKQVASVEVTNTKYSDETKVYDDEEMIKVACSAMEMVRVKHGEVEGNPVPYLTLVFNMTDGTERVLQIADGAVTWEGETKRMVREKWLLEIMDTVFFPEYQEKDK